MAKLIDMFPSWMAGQGIFSALGDWVPWAEDEDVDINSLDIEYFGNRSGYKECSPLLDKMSAFPNEIPLSDVQIARLVNVIKTMFKLSWTKMYEAITTDYKPLENYDLTEHEDRTDTDDTTTTMNKGVTFTYNKGTTTTTSGKAKNTVKSKDSVIPFGGSTEKETNANETTNESLLADNEGTVVTSGYDQDQTSGYDQDVKDGEITIERDLTRHGNIGVTTSQQMLQSEIELRKQHFFEMVFVDLDTIMTSPIWRI